MGAGRIIQLSLFACISVHLLTFAFSNEKSGEVRIRTAGLAWAGPVRDASIVWAAGSGRAGAGGNWGLRGWQRPFWECNDRLAGGAKKPAQAQEGSFAAAE